MDRVVFLILLFPWLFSSDFPLADSPLTFAGLNYELLFYLGAGVFGERDMHACTVVCDEVRGKPQASFLRRQIPWFLRRGL